MGLFGKKKAKAREAEADVAVEAEAEKAVGPYDEAEAPEDDELLECGALRLPPVEGATIQFTVERNREVVLGAVYIVGESALQLQVFAAPKSSDLWDDVRADMISSIASQGGSSREADGEYGQEIHAQMPVEGSRTVNPVRYLGIDGPRWLLRATLTGRAAVDDAEAGAFSAHQNGFTVVALQCAWHAVFSVRDLAGERAVRTGLVNAVSLGGDTDTVAAIAGGLLGAAHGEKAIPAEWRRAVHGWPGMTGGQLADLAQAVVVKASAHG